MSLKGGSHQDELSHVADWVAVEENLISSLDCRIDTTEEHVSSLEEQVLKLQNQADALTPTSKTEANETLAEVKAGVAAMNALVSGKYIC